MSNERGIKNGKQRESGIGRMEKTGGDTRGVAITALLLAIGVILRR
jgi:hypothetical protein